MKIDIFRGKCGEAVPEKKIETNYVRNAVIESISEVDDDDCGFWVALINALKDRGIYLSSEEKETKKAIESYYNYYNEMHECMGD